MDTRLYLDVARIVRHTAWAHTLAADFARWGSLAVLAVLVVLSYVVAASGRNGGGAREIGAAIWTPVAAALCYLLARALEGAIGRLRPAAAVPGAVALVHGLSRHAMPSATTAAAAAVAVGCFLARARLLGALAVLATLVVGFDRIYVGAAFPGDVLAGIGVGVVVCLVGYLPAVVLLERLVRSPVGVIFASGRVRRRGAPASGTFAAADGSVGARATAAGPAGMPPVLASTGAVKVLDERPVAPRPKTPPPPAG